VGVNKFTSHNETPLASVKIDETIRENQTQKLSVLKSQRNNEAVEACLKTIEEKAIDGGNLMPAVIDAVEKYCTLGEISDVLRKVFGEHK
ncbi:MAG: methylmalonyl-CoA mutase family protein, partial [Bacteroidota bacterium]